MNDSSAFRNFTGVNLMSKMVDTRTLEERKKIALMRATIMMKQAPVLKGENGASTEVKPPGSSVDPIAFFTPHKNDNPKIKLTSYGLRPLYSRVEIDSDKWLLTMDEDGIAKLESTPSQRDGVSAEMEDNIRYLGCELIQSGAILLKLPQTAAATGQILFQRYYFLKSFAKFHFEHTVMACLLLASKIEEEIRRPRDVINVFHRLEKMHRLRASGRKITAELTAKLRPKPVDENYGQLRNQVIKAERRLLAALGFVVHVRHPHKLIFTYANSLSIVNNHELMQRAWSYMNDGLRTDMFVRYSAETIACACIYLAARTVTPKVKLPTLPFPWFELFDASDRDIKHISLVLLRLYQRKRAPDWSEINKQLDIVRFGSEGQLIDSAKGKENAPKSDKKHDKEKTDDRESRRDGRTRVRSRSRSRSRSRDRKDSRYRGGDRRGQRDRRDDDRRGDRKAGRSRDYDDRRRDYRDDRDRDRRDDLRDKARVRHEKRESEVRSALRNRRDSSSPNGRYSRKK